MSEVQKEENRLLSAGFQPTHPGETDFESVNHLAMGLVVDVRRPLHELMSKVQS